MRLSLVGLQINGVFFGGAQVGFLQIAAGEPGSAQPHAVKAGPGKAGIIKRCIAAVPPPVQSKPFSAMPGKIIVAERADF